MGRRATLITAHAGCEGGEKNSFESVRKGVEAGADIVEVDIRSTADGHVVLAHDDVLKVGRRKLKVSGATWKEIEELSSRNGVETRRLEEMIDLLKDTSAAVNLDVKNDEVIGRAIAIVQDAGMLDRVVFSGCDAARARGIKSTRPDCQVMLNISRTQYALLRVGTAKFMRAVCEDAARAGCCAINIYYRYCPSELFEYAARRFLPVSVWTVDERSEMEKFLSLGAFSITTNNVSLLKAIITENNALPSVTT